MCLSGQNDVHYEHHTIYRQFWYFLFDFTKLVVNDKYKANLLNTFCCSISEINDSHLPRPVFDKRTGRELDVFNITIDEIKDVLLNLKLGKAVGNDKISHNMLKHTASQQTHQ
jgi:hypothetical protein